MKIKYFMVLKVMTFLALFTDCLAQVSLDCAVLDTHLFRSSAMHWYFIHERENVINARPGHPKHRSNQLAAIGDNILLYQQENGGWPKNYDMQAILTESQKDSLMKAKNMLETTFDNSTTYSQIESMAKIYTVTGEEKYKTACLKGLDYTLAAQYPNGGWPQIYPLKDDYSRYITFNDDVMIGIMQMFKDILDNNPCYEFVDIGRRANIKDSFDRGIKCILECQVKENGKLTAWAQQHDERTLFPAPARKFEPVALCSRESAVIANFLMEIENPEREVINAIQAAIKWFDEQKITGIRIETFEAEEINVYPSGAIKTDKKVVKDPLAPPVWPRFYELNSAKPLFCTRTGNIVYSFAEVDRERRVGYGWYTYLPQETLNKYRSWQKRWIN
ncbi:MAG: pectate lyase [Bacteroidales bacterium]|nr:pectate lyase [Bacteroidales bacterium]